jgi:pimeloyl-ACP methyl ester carboxylesterase
MFVDALGFGQSPWPEVRYTLEDHLGALRRTLLREGATRRVTLVGHSFGAILAAYYAAQHPEDVKRLCLLGTPVFDSEAEARRRIRRLSFLTSLFSLNPVLARAGCDVLCAFRPLVRRAVPVVRRALPREVAEDAVLHHWGSIDGTLRNVILTRPVAQALARVGPKTILVHGREDEVTPVDRVRTLAADIGATLVITGSDHHGYLVEDRPVLLALLQSGSEPSTQGANATGSDRSFARTWGADVPDALAGARPRNP